MSSNTDRCESHACIHVFRLGRKIVILSTETEDLQVITQESWAHLIDDISDGNYNVEVGEDDVLVYFCEPGSMLHVTPAEWDAFKEQVKAGKFDTVHPVGSFRDIEKVLAGG